MPFFQHEKEDRFVRTFSSNVESEELVWHRDKNDRIVKVIFGEGWQFQVENQLPIYLKKGQILFIPKDTYHRVIKGVSELTVEIKEIK
jgi:quercetin dioxygenase-like cupin family protein